MAKQPTSLQKAYQKYYKQKLRLWNITTPTAIKDKKRRQKFYDELSEDWQKRRRKIRDPEKLKGKYYNQYATKIKRRITTPRIHLESGMLVELRYSTMGKNGILKPPKKYLVLILHPKFRNKIHALRFDFISPLNMKKLIKDVGLVDCDATEKIKKLDIKQLALVESESRRFYHQKLKKIMKTKYNSSYRTFNYSTRTKISNVIKFDFAKFI